MQNLTRRDFIRLVATTVGGAMLAGCGGNQLARMTATPVVTVGSPPATSASPVAAGPADMVLVNGKIITVDAQDTITQAVAIKNGLLQAVGKSDEIRTRAGAATQVIDLKDKTVTPGLIDEHCHLELVGMFNDQFIPFMPPEVTSIQGLQNKVAEMVTKTPKGNWIVGYYLTVGGAGMMPRKQDLDKVAPEHPVWIMQQGGHYGTANSLALKIANITASTPNPNGGIIERDARGEPTGVFYNHRAMDLLRRNIPTDARDDPRAYIASAQDLFAACGVTSFQDNNVRDPEIIRAYLEIGKQGKSKLRQAVYYTLEWPADLNTALTKLERYQDSFARFAGYKFLIDGQAPTAYTHQPHEGASWNMPTWDPVIFKRTVRALHDTGLQICVHCAGDAAVDLVIDAYEEAMKANPRPDPRHRVEHAVLTTRDATKRMKDLGIVVGVHPTFIRVGGDGWVKYFGEERVKRAMVVREWLDNGVRIALGSDAPTTPWYTPQTTLWGALTRKTISGQVMGPEHCLTIQEAMRAHTMGAAYAAHEEKVKGSIEVGKFADLTVWNEDPYTASLERLWQIPIAMTIIGGRIVHPA